MALATLRVGMILDPSKFNRQLAEASKQMSRFARNLTSGHDRASKALSKHTMGLKDTSRIVQGIMVSQVFYAAVGAIRDATSALTQFNEQLDYSQVTYSALFGSADLASKFSTTLQDMAINSIFDYQALDKSAKKLLAYGIEYENLGYIMRGLMDLGAMSGDTAALDRIALALGQIQAKGKLSAEEMRQLANAYVPINDIVQKSFNLTPDQMGSIGDLNLPAHEVINSIVDYANAKFGSVSDAAMLTITGLKNRIVDTMKVMGSEMMMPLTRAWKSFLVYFDSGLQGIRESFNASGWGGVFDYLVPDPDTQTIIRAFLANVHNGFMAIASLVSGIAPILGNIGRGFAIAFNIVAPVVNNAVHALGALLHMLSQSSYAMGILRFAAVAAAGAFVVLKVKALASLVIVAVGKAVNFVSKSLIILSSIITKHPIIMLMAGLAIALIGVSAASNNANNSLSSLFKTLSGSGGGLTQEDIFKDIAGSTKDAADAAGEFDNRLTSGADAAQKLEDGINKAGKQAAKTAKEAAGLLSFDEVFKLQEPKDTTGSGDAGSGVNPVADIEGLVSGLGSLGEALIPDIPDFSSFTDEFTDRLFGDLYESVARVASGAMAGGLVGALVGFAIGGLITKTLAGALAGAKLGAQIGAVAGAGFAAFWGDTYKELEAKLADIGAGSAAGALLGALAGFLIGAIATKSLPAAITAAQWGAGIGAIAGGVLGGIFDGFYKILQERIDGIASGAAEGMLVGGLAGLIIGAFATKSIQGALTGARIGAGLGALIGGTIGGVFDEGETSLTETLENMFSDISAASYGAVIGGLVGMIIGAIVGALAGGVGAIPGAKLGASLGAAIGGLGTMLYQYLKNAGITEKMGEWFSSLGDKVGEWFSGIGTAISDWWAGVKESWNQSLDNLQERWSAKWNELSAKFTWWKEDVSESFSNWWSDAKQTWSDGMENLKTNFSEGLDRVKTRWSNKWDEIGTKFNTWKDDTKKAVSEWWTDTKQEFSDGLDKVKSNWSTKWSEIKTSASTKWDEITSKLSTWWADTKQKFSDGLDNVKEKWGTKWDEVKTSASTKWDTIKTKCSTWLDGILKKNGTSLDEVKTKWSTKWDEIKDKLSTWWDDMKTSMGTWLEEKIWKPISDFFNLETFWSRLSGLLVAIKTKVSDWWGGLKSMFSDEPVTVTTQVNTTHVNTSGTTVKGSTTKKLSGHATGGIFNREHIARFAEGNKAEAIIPLENASAMQPFVNAVSRGLLEELAPTLVQNSNSYNSNLPPMYVGTLIADERGLKQLYKKFELIEMQENARRGVAKA